MAESVCLCCGGPVAAIYTVRSFAILRCASCGHGRTRIPADFDLEAYYSRAYFQGEVEDGYADYVGSEATLRAEFRSSLDHLLRYNPARARLLEFGSAYGFFLEEAASHFGHVSGIELCEDAVGFSRSRGIDVVHGVVAPGNLPAAIDVAVGLDVIEHVPDPQETIRLLADRLNPGGLLMLSTGDWDSVLARWMGPKWRLMTPPQHLSFFTARSMRKLLASAGLEVLELSHPGKRVPLGLMAYQLQRIAGLKPSSSHWLNKWGIPVNLWDAMRVIARK